MSKHTTASVIDSHSAKRRSFLWAGLLGSLFLLAACAGDGTGPPSPPPPPPPGPPPPPSGDVVSLDLDLNDVFVITDADSMAFELPGAASAREYRVIVQSASSTGGGLWPVKFTGQASSAAASVGSVRASYGYAAPASAGIQELLKQEAESVRERQRSWVETVRLQERAWNELRRIGARAAPAGAKVARAGAEAARAAVGSGSAGARLVGVPSNGDEVEFFMPIGEDLSLSCTVDDSTKVLQAEIRSVGDHFVIARDTQGTDAFSAEDYAEIQDVLDEYIYHVDTGYFGETADIDENERVIVLITEEVNKLTDLTEQLIFLGFFLPSDLADPVDCAASNAGEIVYLRAPDPDGEFGEETSVERAVEILKSTTSHEFQHLINSEQRFILGSDGFFASSEEIWLNEGLSHLAEELVGLAVMGQTVRANLGIDAAVSDIAAFNTFLIDNFFNLGATARDEEGCDGWMISPETSITINSTAIGNPPGCGSLTMRGWSYLFLRWLGDHFGPAGNGVIPGSNEQEFFRELARGGPNHAAGKANIEQAVAAFGDSSSWEELLADFLLMVAVDDLPGVSLPARSQLPSWDLRDLYRGLHENTGTGPAFPQPYPLKLEALLFEDVDLDFSVRSASAKYFTLLATTTTPDYVIRVTDQAGEPLRANVGAQVTVVRLR